MKMCTDKCNYSSKLSKLVKEKAMSLGMMMIMIVVVIGETKTRGGLKMTQMGGCISASFAIKHICPTLLCTPI